MKMIKPSYLTVNKKPFHSTPNRKSAPVDTLVELATQFPPIGPLEFGLMFFMGFGMTLIGVWLFPFAPAEALSSVTPEIPPLAEMLDNTFGVGAIVPIGFQSLLNINTGIELLNIYIHSLANLFGNFGPRLQPFLEGLNVGELQALLFNLEGLIRIHEFIFQALVGYGGYMDNIGFQPMTVIEELHDSWREIGNNLMEVYREIESLLNISEDDSHIPTQWFEED